MIADFEQRLADVLGTRLPAPFTGRAAVAPGGGGNAVQVLLAAEQVTVLPSAMGDAVALTVPGDPAPRRVVRARCRLRVRVEPGAGEGRAQERAGLDAVLYALDAPDLRNGAGLAGGAPDPGFLVHRLQVIDAALPMDDDDEALRPGLVAEAEGVFWPAGEAGQAGVQIVEARLRGVQLPLALQVGGRLEAGGAPVPLTLTVPARAHTVTGGDGGPPPAVRLALRLVAPSGGAGAGALEGAVDGVVRADLAGEALALTYTPPAEAARDALVVHYDDGEDGLGAEIARFTLVVRAAP